MLRTIAAMLSLLLPMSVPASSPAYTDEVAPQPVESWPVVDPVHEPIVTTFVIDDSRLPGTTGWFLVPIEADGFVSITLESQSEFHPVGERASGFAVVVLQEGASPRVLSSVLEPTMDRVAETNWAGDRLACCDWESMGTAQPWRMYAQHGGARSWFDADASRPLYIGMVADGWTPRSSASVVVTAVGAPAHLGAQHQGGDARVVDLVDEAHRKGTNARAGGSTLLGAPGVGRLAMEGRAGSLLMLQYEAWGDASALLDVRHGARDLIRAEPVRKTTGFALSVAEGPLRVALDELEDSKRFDGTSRVRALAIAAGMPAFGAGFEWWDERHRHAHD